MVPPTDPWYEDLTDDYPYDPAKAEQLLAESGAGRPDPAPAAANAARTPTPAGRSSRASSRRSASPSSSTSWSSRPRGSTRSSPTPTTTCRSSPTSSRATWRRCSATRSTTRATATRRSRSCSRRPTRAPTEEQVAVMTAGRPAAVRGRRRRLAVPAAQPDRRRRGRHRAAGERDLGVLRRHRARSRRDRPGPATYELTPWSSVSCNALGILLASLLVSVGASCSRSWRCCRATRRGSRSGSTPPRRRWRSCAQQFGLDRSLRRAVRRLGCGAWSPATSARPTSRGAAIGPQVADRLPVTMWLVGAAMVIAVADRDAARHAHGGAAPHGSRGPCSPRVSQVGVAVPAFLAGILLITLFAVKLGWLPSNGWTPPAEDPVEFLEQLVLPALSLGLVQGAVLTRYVRSAVLDVLREDYLRTARAKGLRPGPGAAAARAAQRRGARWSPCWGCSSRRCWSARWSSSGCS